MDWFLYDIGLRHERVNRVLLPLPNTNLHLLYLFWFWKVSSLSLKHINLCEKTMAFQIKLLSQCVFQRQYDYEIFQNVKPALQNHIAKIFNLALNLSLISYLQTYYPSERKGVAVTSCLVNICLDEGISITFLRRLPSLSPENIFKTPSKHLDHDKYICLGHTSSRRLAKTYSRRIINVFQTY